MKDNQAIITALQDALLQRFGDEVDLIFQYGSHIRGTAHQYSDVDVSWVPVHADAWGNITVMVDDTLFDLYPIHWAKLEQMADFRDVSSTVLLHNRILYQRSQAAADRFGALTERLRAHLQPEARPQMVRQALERFQDIGYDYYLLRRHVALDDPIGCLRQAQAILRTVLHCVAVSNQAPVDTRKLAQVLALPQLPEGFGEHVHRVVAALTPQAALTAVDALLGATHPFLLELQRRRLNQDATWPALFDAAYPELKRDLQAVMQACEQQDLFAAKNALFSLLHELSRGIAQVESGFVATSFNGLRDYEQDLTALGFPALAPLLLAGDFAELHRQCLIFDVQLKALLMERAVKLNNFASLEELKRSLLLPTNLSQS
jgi:hypothetical protein